MNFRRRFQFGLRSLLAATTIIGVGLWWWSRPVPVEEDWAGPWWGMTVRYSLRRSWDGRRYHVGPATLTYPSGQVAARADVNGKEYQPIEFGGRKFNGIRLGGTDERQEYWHEDGRKLDWKEWFMFISQEYFPRRTHGEVISTEDEWRRTLADLETQFEKGAINVPTEAVSVEYETGSAAK